MIRFESEECLELSISYHDVSFVSLDSPPCGNNDIGTNKTSVQNKRQEENSQIHGCQWLIILLKRLTACLKGRGYNNELCLEEMDINQDLELKLYLDLKVNWRWMEIWFKIWN